MAIIMSTEKSINNEKGSAGKKCKDSPVYFYNKYVRKEGQKELTEAEYNDFVKQVEYQRNMPLKLRKHYNDRPMLPSECFEKLPDLELQTYQNSRNYERSRKFE